MDKEYTRNSPPEHSAHKRESISLHNAIIFLPCRTLSYFIINPRVSAYIKFDDRFSIFMTSSYTEYCKVLVI